MGKGENTAVSYDYERSPSEIYRQSFETVRNEARIGELPTDIQPVATRLIHSCGMIEVVDKLEFSDHAVEHGRAALELGRPVFCDVEMVRSGIIERLLPARNELVCTLNEDGVPDHAQEIGNTRSAAAVDFWNDDLQGAVVAIGNAPTALFRLLERVAEGGPKPALVVGIPVGFVGAVESKQALAENPFALEYITVSGRQGGSAMASAVVNAIAGGLA